MCFLVAFLRQFVGIDWVGALTKNSAKELILRNVTPIFWHPDVTHLTVLPAPSIDGGPIPLLHLGIASVQEIAQSQNPYGNVALTC
jgi:hypothetical protein